MATKDGPNVIPPLPHISVTVSLLSLHRDRDAEGGERSRKPAAVATVSNGPLNEPRKHGGFISSPTGPALSVRPRVFPPPKMKRPPFRAPAEVVAPPNKSPSSSQPLPLLLLFATYLSFLFCPFCFPAKLLNSSSVGC